MTVGCSFAITARWIRPFSLKELTTMSRVSAVLLGHPSSLVIVCTRSPRSFGAVEGLLVT
jgi:hypothetical protein